MTINFNNLTNEIKTLLPAKTIVRWSEENLGAFEFHNISIRLEREQKKSYTTAHQFAVFNDTKYDDVINQIKNKFLRK